MRKTLRLQIVLWAGFIGWNGAALGQQANNPSDQFSTLGRRATSINQDMRQGPSNGTNVTQNNNAPTGNNAAGNGAGPAADGPSPATFSPPGQTINPDRGTDVDFARKLVQHGLLKAELGKLAVEKGQSDQVRNIGQALIDDHGRWAKTLARIADSNKFTLPEKMPAKYKTTIDRLRGLSGPAFDRAFLKELGHYQQADLDLLHAEVADGTIQPLRNFASRGIPGLERRMDVVNEESDKVALARK